MFGWLPKRCHIKRKACSSLLVLEYKVNYTVHILLSIDLSFLDELVDNLQLNT
jgi:hypothetical protein